MKKSNFRQGRYKVRNRDKYKGDVTNVIYRSSWEYRVCQFLDNNPNVLEWASEPFAIPYVKPTDKRIHKYYIDFFVKYKNAQGEIVTEIVEIKPASQTRPSTSRNKKTALFENITYAINAAKWEAAQRFATRTGIRFRVCTAEDIFK